MSLRQMMLAGDLSLVALERFDRSAEIVDKIAVRDFDRSSIRQLIGTSRFPVRVYEEVPSHGPCVELEVDV